jgi:Cytochrome c554 and c-prime
MSRYSANSLLEFGLASIVILVMMLIGIWSWPTRSFDGSKQASISNEAKLATVTWNMQHVATQSSCASATCHGQPVGDTPSWKNAALTFTQHDTHAQAFQVLFTARSQKIVQQLTHTKQHEFPTYFEYLERNCIKCHASSPQLSAEIPLSDKIKAYANGVSCNACHGESQKWEKAHLLTSWKEQRQQLPAFHCLEQPVAIATICVKCHVGSATDPSQQVTHDLIAAGHPRLDFELVAWREQLPRHWSGGGKQFEPLSMWQRGQLESATIYTAFANAMLANAENTHVEFALYECAACHVELQFSGTKTQFHASDTPILIDPLWFAPPNKSLDTTTQLAEQLIRTAPKINSWDRLQSWFYAVQVVVLQAEQHNRNAAATQKLRKALQELLGYINKNNGNRYTSASLRFPETSKMSHLPELRLKIEQVTLAIEILTATIKNEATTEKQL